MCVYGVWLRITVAGMKISSPDFFPLKLFFSYRELVGFIELVGDLPLDITCYARVIPVLC
jgi:hypothetical protein